MSESFSQLTTALEQELHRLHYTEGTISYYRRMWSRIAAFLEAEHVPDFTEELGLGFLDQQYDFLARQEAGTLTQSMITALRVVRMLGDFQQHHSILRRYYKHRQLLSSDEFIETLDAYARACQAREYSQVTQAHYEKSAEKFFSFLESQVVTHTTQITPPLIDRYAQTWLGYSAKTVELELTALRSVLRFLYAQGRSDRDLSLVVPAVPSRRHTRIPSVWSSEHVSQLLAVVDRGNPGGKRDYAMILLVVRLGLRSMDVKHLQLSHLHWDTNRIEFVSSKTGRTLSLPLLPDVGWAIIDYLQNGRPAVSSPYVFLRHLAPLEPFSDSDHLYQVIEKYMKQAHLPLSPHKKRGMHSLRHTLASVLLEQNTPLTVISDILGHSDTDTTAVYLKVDINRLRECALNLEEVLPS
ncbi:site-specific integrase [Ferrimicrobium acidiphilum]|jgi:site-specific recombinase XerD|uniref:Tyrosine recombinase XerD n=1 Tax=Ferrimicrobium acidiphilum DSM 19497 TaxID=1121877 RepID=A0A0D8FPR0_9ACTN|nr:site-specific integrase [Ferrimicrobium acidiphilum]KJE75270.1 tyrosine recombinase XerD [Ferrimicrobium acidiphilum DSM 19497]